MSDKKWVPFPLYIFSHEDGDFLLPTTQTISASWETVNKIKQDLEAAEAVEKPDPVRVEYLRKWHQDATDRVKAMIATAEELKTDPRTIAYKYELHKPPYGEYVRAQEESNDWFLGEPKPNDAKLGVKCLAGNLRLNGKELNEEEVKAIEDPVVGEALWHKLKSMMFPNPERLPFLSSPSINS